MSHRAAFLAAAVVCAPAHAGGFLDLYYVPKADFEIKDGDTLSSDGGRGYGIRGVSSEPGSPYFFTGEYHTLTYDGFEGTEFDTEAKFTRLGLGATSDSGMFFTVEWVRQDVSDPDNSLRDRGYAAHLGFQSGASGAGLFYVDGAWLDVGDLGTGYEFSIGGVIPVSDTSGVFVDYRSITQQDGDGPERTFSDLRSGLRFSF